MRQLHPSNAGTAGPINLPPDPSELNRYIEFPTLESQDEEAHMQQEATQEEAQDTTSHTPQYGLEEDNMSQGDTDAEVNANSTETTDDDTSMQNIVKVTDVNEPLDVNGGIDDDDLLEMIASTVETIHTNNTEDLSPPGLHRHQEEQC